MRKTKIFLGVILIFLLAAGITFAQNTPIKKANYPMAERYSTAKMAKMVFSTSVDAHWLKHSDRFWYSYETTEGKTFYLADPLKRAKQALFDNAKMAAMLTLLTKDPYDAQHLPIDRIKFVKEDRAIQFEVQSSQEEEAKKVEEKEKTAEVKPKKKIYTFEYDLATGKLILLEDYKKPPEKPAWANISPDDKIIVFGRHYNLYWMDRENYEKILKDEKTKDIVEHQLTTDGEEDYSYYREEGGMTDEEKEKKKDERKSVNILWSQDSKKFALVRNDSRKVKDLWVINSVAEPRPTLETYKYQMPGEAEAPQYDVLIFDLEKQQKIQIKDDLFKDQNVQILSAPLPAKTRDDDYRPQLWLSETSDKLYFSRTSRDLHRIDICVADAATGEVKALIEERLNTYVETRPLGLVDNGKELIHWSERDGWAHFYLYDGGGKAICG